MQTYIVRSRYLDKGRKKTPPPDNPTPGPYLGKGLVGKTEVIKEECIKKWMMEERSFVFAVSRFFNHYKVRYRMVMVDLEKVYCSEI